MSDQGPHAKLVLLKEYSKGGRDPDLAELRRQLEKLPGFAAVKLTPNSRSTVVASVPALNQRQRQRLKDLVNEHVAGWSVIEEQSYGLPTTF